MTKDLVGCCVHLLLSLLIRLERLPRCPLRWSGGGAGSWEVLQNENKESMPVGELFPRISGRVYDLYIHPLVFF